MDVSFAGGLLRVMLVAFFFAGIVLLALWAVKDAMSRGKSPLFVLIAVVIFFPSGLIAWLLFRPSRLETFEARG
jgi:hypothetical protein